MADRHLAHVAHYLNRQAAADATDAELLTRFLRRRDEAAFAALVDRHGGMVHGVCRRLLGHTQDAEDACQAVFVVLARKAGSVRRRDALPGWLHGVACRVCRKLQSRRPPLRPCAGPPAVAPTDVPAEVTWREIRRVLDEELNRLPAGYRAPLVLCYLEGKTQDEAARALGWSLGTVRGRVERGRELLRKRLTRRGVTLSGALLGAVLAQHAAAGAEDAVALRVALLNVLRPAGAGVVPERVLVLAEGVIRTMSHGKYVWAAAVGVTLALLGTAAAGFLGRGEEANPPDPAPPRVAAQAVPAPRVAQPEPGQEVKKTPEPERERPKKKDPAMEANLAWHKGVGPSAIRTSWFPDGKANIAMIGEVELAKPSVMTARQVYNWATQASQRRKLTPEQAAALRELAGTLPASQGVTDLNGLFLVSVRDGTQVRTYRYSRFAPPPGLGPLVEVVGVKR